MKMIYVFCRMEYIRKEVKLQKEIIEKLQKLADKKGWKLKPFMEKVLIKESSKA